MRVEYHHDYGGTGMILHHFCTSMAMVIPNSYVLFPKSWRESVHLFPLSQSWIRGNTRFVCDISSNRGDTWSYVACIDFLFALN